jgi:hypothetical protein
LFSLSTSHPIVEKSRVHSLPLFGSFFFLSLYPSTFFFILFFPSLFKFHTHLSRKKVSHSPEIRTPPSRERLTTLVFSANFRSSIAISLSTRHHAYLDSSGCRSLHRRVLGRLSAGLQLWLDQVRRFLPAAVRLRGTLLDRQEGHQWLQQCPPIHHDRELIPQRQLPTGLSD